MSQFSDKSSLEKFQIILKGLKDFKNYDTRIKEQYPQMDSLNYLTVASISNDALLNWYIELGIFFLNVKEFCYHSFTLKRFALLCMQYVSMYLRWEFDISSISGYRCCVDMCYKEMIPFDLSLDSPIFLEFKDLVENPTPDKILQFKLRI